MARAIADSDFKSEVTEFKGYVLVDFWAQWCGPCRQLAPVIDEVASELEGEIKVLKMDIDKNTETPASCFVRSIPALFIFKDGQSVASKTGYQTKETLISWIREEMAK